MDDTTERQEFEKWKQYGLSKQTDVEHIKNLANRLIENLYRPCDDERMLHGIAFVADEAKVKQYQLGEDAINWGDLGVVEVVRVQGGSYDYLVTVEEAAPHCQNLINYLEGFLKRWGWNVRVETEW